MKLAELEKKLEVRFPKAFHRIYETGAMKWLEMSKEEITANREEYINDSKAFLMLDCSCELYIFDKISEAIDDLKEWIDEQEKDTDVTLSEGITLIPFGQNGGGDLYCFLYSSETEEPMVILYCHDEYGNPSIEGHDFDEFIYIQMLDAVANEEDMDGEHFNENLNYLDEKYRQMIAGKDADTLIDEYDELEFDEAEIWD